MKKTLPILVIVLVLLSFVSCNQAHETEYRTVTFKTFTDDKIESQKVVYGAKAAEPGISLSKGGFEFSGWTLDGEPYDFNSPVVRDITLLASWKVKCTVTFLDSDDKDGVSSLGIEAQVIDYSQKVTRPQDPEKNGYTFVRWVSPEGSEYNFDLPVTDTCLQLRAEWKANEYSYSYNANGGTVPEGKSLPEGGKYTYGESFTAGGVNTGDFYKRGCIFEGWTLNADGSGDVYKSGDSVKGLAGGTTLYAKWTDPGYSAGDRGPSGGIIIYVYDNVYNSFKYVEAAPQVLGTKACYGYYRPLVYPSTQENTAVGCSDDSLGDGKTNTTRLVDKMGDSACLEESARQVYVGGGTTRDEEITGDYAAHMCRKHTVVKDGVTYDDWYLPCIYEMKAFYDAIYKATGNGVPSGIYLTSVEGYDDEDAATKCWTVEFVTDAEGTKGTMNKECTEPKSLQCTVWPVRYI